MLKTKIVSSQEKIFVDDNIEKFSVLEKIAALGGERLSLQLIYSDVGPKHIAVRPFCDLKITGELAEFATVRDVRWVPVDRPIKPGVTEKDIAAELIYRMLNNGAYSVKNCRYRLHHRFKHLL